MFKKRKLFYSALTLAAFLLSSCSVSFDISSDNKNNSDSISSETSSIGDSSEPNTSTSTGDNTSSADNNEPIPDTDDHKATPTVKYSALTYGKAPTYNESGSLPYYRGVGTDNNGKYYDTSFNEVNESDLILPSFSSSCPDILDDVFSDDKSTKSNWDAVTNNVEHWTHVPGSYEVLIPEDKAGWQLSKQSYTDIDMKIKIDGLTPMNPFVEGSYITKAFLIGADASKTNGYYPSGYAICLFDNGGDNWLQIYHLDEYNFNDLRGVFVGGIYGDAAHNFNHREIRVKVRGNVLSLYDTDGRQMQIEEGHLGFYTPNLVLEHYKGGKVGILNWTCSNNVDSSFTIKEFSGIKKEDAAKFKVEGVDFDKQNTEKRASVIVLAGQSNMEGNTRAWDNYTTSNYLKNYCNASLDDLTNPDKVVVAQPAPAVRFALGEEFGMPAGTIVTGKMATALRDLGFDYAFDTDFAADLTIMEEGTEILQRLNKFLAGDKDVKLPIMTSCCPAWVNFYEHEFPDLLDYPSTAKSPAQMFGAIAKTYWAEKMGIPREKLVVVSIMPCLAKKYEAGREEFKVDGNPDVDYSISTRELGRLIKRANIDFANLPESDFDSPLGESTGAGAIFGITGGVMEAALRTVYEVHTGKTLPHLEFNDVRGFEGIKEATIDLNGFELKVCVAHTLSNARKVMNALRAGKLNYHVVEVMACPGGCIGGAGQPYHHGNIEILKARAAAVYREDEGKKLRKSHENPDIQKLYKEFLGEPCGEKSHHLLHTHYFDKSIH